MRSSPSTAAGLSQAAVPSPIPASSTPDGSSCCRPTPASRRTVLPSPTQPRADHLRHRPAPGHLHRRRGRRLPGQHRQAATHARPALPALRTRAPQPTTRTAQRESTCQEAGSWASPWQQQSAPHWWHGDCTAAVSPPRAGPSRHGYQSHRSLGSSRHSAVLICRAPPPMLLKPEASPGRTAIQHLCTQAVMPDQMMTTTASMNSALPLTALPGCRPLRPRRPLATLLYMPVSLTTSHPHQTLMNEGQPARTSGQIRRPGQELRLRLPSPCPQAQSHSACGATPRSHSMPSRIAG
jgi:hypothetical protein